MNKKLMLSVIAVIGALKAEDQFDLKTYERSLKRYIPWSLTGSAQDLRSDAKNYLQLILRDFILLRPDVIWSDEQKPSQELIKDSIKGLKAYLTAQGNERKRPQVLDSLNYIINAYIPEIQKLLQSAPVEGLSAEQKALLDQKKQLFNEYSELIQAGRSELTDSDRKFPQA